jgi:hypothetical protein
MLSTRKEGEGYIQNKRRKEKRKEREEENGLN